MAQVQLATKISIECWNRLEKYCKETEKTKASTVEEALTKLFDSHEQSQKPRIERGPDGKFHKVK